MSNAALSDATTQPVSSLPSTNGRTPCRSRAAYKVCSSIKTRENAPSSCGNTAIALASTFFSSCSAIKAVIISVSVVMPLMLVADPSSFCTNSAKSPVFVRLPLWAKASVPYLVGRNVGCAFTQVLDPVVLYRQWPIARLPLSVARSPSVNTCETRPISLKIRILSPSLVAIPADSVPRCCKAYKP